MSRTPTSLPALFVGESDTFSSTFSLSEGETILTSTAALSVLWGTDVDTSTMLVGGITIADETVITQVVGEVAGNIYTLRFTVTTSTGRTLVDEMSFEVRA